VHEEADHVDYEGTDLAQVFEQSEEPVHRIVLDPRRYHWHSGTLAVIVGPHLDRHRNPIQGV